MDQPNAAPRSKQPADAVNVEPDFFSRLSPSSRTALNHAEGIRLGRGEEPSQDKVHMEHLIIGLFLKNDGPAERLFKKNNIGSEEALRSLLQQHVELRLPSSSDYTPGMLTKLPPPSDHVMLAFREAQTVADRMKSEQIQSRHLLYGALSVSQCHVIKPLLERGVRREDIPMGEAPVPDAGMAIVGAESDTATGKDLLNLDSEIETLSALVAARDTKTPVSIGLFGEWGGGKSFFMQKMDERIRELRTVAASDPESPFCQNIVQLWFNAWHYIDKSLWASIGAEIFEGLAHSITEDAVRPDGRSKIEDERTGLLVQKAEVEDRLKEVQKAYEDSHAKLGSEQAAVRDVEAKTDAEIERSLGAPAIASELLRVANEQPEIKSALDEAARKLGLPELSRKKAEAEQQVKELIAIGSYWQTVVKKLRSGSKGWIPAAILLGLIGLGLGNVVIDQFIKLEGLVRWLTATLAAIIAAASPVLLIAGRATSLIKNARERMKKPIEDERRRVLNAAQARQATAEREADESRQALEAVKQEMREIDQKLELIQPQRQLKDFIQARFKSDDYTKHFGVIARARQDFEELTRLMTLVHNEPTAAQAARFPPIDRIVLYIDDLDRCPEPKVFEVLQAVHLLLAFPLFVVVVGVDPRWLLHSLRSQLGAFRDQAGRKTTDSDESARWQSTPLNYLEKIFQIPFTLRPMNETGYEHMIDNLTQARVSTPHIEAKALPQIAPTARPATAPEPQPALTLADANKVPTSGPAPPQQATQTAAHIEHRKTYERLRLEEWEKTFMKNVFALIPSPRATKRFVNVYRLLRGITKVEERSALIGNETDGAYRAVLLLLATITGYPTEASMLIRELLQRFKQGTAPFSWWELVENLQSEVERNGQSLTADAPPTAKLPMAKSVSAKVAQTPSDPPETMLDDEPAEETARWADFFRDLERVHQTTKYEPTCELMARWAPAVARYSFASGRLAIAEERSAARAKTAGGAA